MTFDYSSLAGVDSIGEVEARGLADTYYSNRKNIYFLGDEDLNITIGLTVGVFVAMAFEMSSPEVCFLVALSVLMLAEVLKMDDVLSGFANDGLITIGSLFLVVGAMEKSHMIDYGSRLAFGYKASKRWGIFRFLSSSFVISAYFNNIPQVAIMIPIVKDWAKLRGISSSQLLIPLSYTVLAGGMLATIGTSTNLVIQGLLTNDPKKREQFGFFDPAVVGAPAGAILIIYMMIAAPYLLPHHVDKVDELFLRSQNHLVEVTVDKRSPFIGLAISDFVGRLGTGLDCVLRIDRVHQGDEKEDSIEAGTQEGYSNVRTIEDRDGEIELVEKSNNLRTSDSRGNLVDLGSKLATHAYDSNIATDSGEKSAAAKNVAIAAAIEKTNHVLRVINDAVYTPFIDYYTKARIAFEMKYPKFFGLENFDPSLNFYPLTGRPIVVERMDQPSPDTILQPGDIITFANAENLIDKIAKAMPWERVGLSIFGGLGVVDFPIFGDIIVEAIISPSSNFVGLNFNVAANVVYNHYGAATFSFRKEDDVISSREDLLKRRSSGSGTLSAGDTILIITNSSGIAKLNLSRDFSGVHKSSQVPEIASYWSFYPVLVFMTIVSLVAANEVEMTAAALSMASLFFIGGWLKPKEIETFVDVRLLMLMGCSLSFAKAMTTTGLAIKIADAIAGGNISPGASLYLIYIATLLITELISNNAAAAMMYPISVALADSLGLSYKPYAMVVMQAASMAFMCPIGYPTHVMVWIPGQYNFFDYCRFGLIPNLIWLIMSCIICPAVWPFKP